MISVQNHRPLLSGNKVSLLCASLLLLFVTSCDLFRRQPKVPERPEPTEKPEPTDTLDVGEAPDLPEDSLDLIYPRIFKEKYTVAVALPFFNEAEERNNSRNNLISRIATEYYWGMQLAFDTLTTCGANYELLVFDTKNDSFVCDRIIDQLRYKEIDAVVGPLLKKNIGSYYNYSAEKRVNLLTPLYHYADSAIPNAYYFNTMPSEKDMAKRAATWVNKLDTASVDRILIIRQPLIPEKDIAETFVAALDSNLRGRVKEKSISKNALISGLSLDLFGDSTIIFVPTDDELFVNTFFSSLRRTGKGASVIGLAKWMEYKTLEPELMMRYNLHLLSSYYINYNDPQVKNFVQQYRERYHTEPSDFAIRGYDDALWLGRQLYEEGSYFQRVIKRKNFTTLHTDYIFRQNNVQRDYRNNKVILLRFRNFELEEVK